MSDQYIQTYYILTNFIPQIIVGITFVSLMLGVGVKFLKKM